MRKLETSDDHRQFRGINFLRNISVHCLIVQIKPQMLVDQPVQFDILEEESFLLTQVQA